MNLTLIIVLAVLLVLLLYATAIYNNLVRLGHAVAQAWSNIDVSLKQRHDELPKLIAVCKEHMGYEQETLERVVRARGAVAQAAGRGDTRGLGAAEGELRAGLGRLFALVENYPDLKANQSFQQLSARISALEDTIADRRELYNACVNLYNVRLQQVPDALIARPFGFKPKDLLRFVEARADVDVAALFR